jgi:hypothetical protein
MNLTWKDAAATGLTAGVVTLYGAYLAEADLGVWSNPRMLGVTTLVLGLGACATGAEPTGTPSAARKVAGVAAAVAGLAALWTIVFGTSLTLAVAVAATAFLWLLATIRHAVTTASTPTRRATPVH